MGSRAHCLRRPWGTRITPSYGFERRARRTPITREELIAAQKDDVYCNKVRGKFGDKNHPFRDEADGLLVRVSPLDGAVQKVLPECLRARALYLAHYPLLAGHARGAKMYDTMRVHYYWPYMATDIFQTARDCRECAQARGTRYKNQKLMKTFKATQPLDFVALDLLGPLIKTKTGCTDILVITDRFSKMARVVPLKSTKAPYVADAFIEHWVIPYGLPRKLLSDNGPQFVGKFFQAMCTILGTKHLPTSAYHPQTNGQTERYNQTLVNRLRIFVSEHQDDWDRLIQPLTYAYNLQVNRTTGQPPFKLALTRQPPDTVFVDDGMELDDVDQLSPEEARLKVLHRAKDLIERASARTSQQQARYKKAHDKKVRSIVQIRPGDEVFIDNPPSLGASSSDGPNSKLSRKASQAYKVIQVTDTTAKVLIDGIEDMVSLDRVTRAPPPLDPQTLKPQQTETPVADDSKAETKQNSPPPKEPTPERSEKHPGGLKQTKEYVVEKLIDHRNTTKGPEYLVRWYKFPPEKDTWEPYHHIPQHFRMRYHIRLKKAATQKSTQAQRGRRH